MNRYYILPVAVAIIVSSFLGTQGAAVKHETLPLVSSRAWDVPLSQDAYLVPTPSPAPAATPLPTAVPTAEPIPQPTPVTVVDSRASESVALAIEQAFPFDLGTAWYVAKRESLLDPNAYNENWNGSVDLGLFQINSIHAWRWPDYWTAWSDPVRNAQWALELWQEQGWRPWRIY